MSRNLILIVDDHAMMRQGLRVMLDATPNVHTVGEASDGKEAVEMALQLQPHLTIMDITMPGMDGIEATRRIVEADQSAKILILSQHESAGYVVTAIKAGASGYVPKKAAKPDLILAISAVIGGDSFLHPSVASVFLDAYRNERAHVGAATAFSEVDRTILNLIAQGRTTNQISQLLRMTKKAVTRRRSRMMHTIDDRTVNGLIRYALQNKPGFGA